MNSHSETQPDIRFYFGSNFKMHKTAEEVKVFTKILRDSAVQQPDVQLFIIPPFTALGSLAEIQRPANLWIGAQNMHWADAGAYTGEISAPMLRDLGLDLVMLGHAERRQIFGETDQALNKKVLNATRHGLRVLLCVGETAEQRQYGVTAEILATQLKIALSGYEAHDLNRLLIAYEPVWAIGAGSTEATAADVAPSIRHIKATLQACFGDAGQHVPVLYGGSVNQDNCMQYVHATPADGLFVGRSAWQPEGFLKVLNAGLSALPNPSQDFTSLSYR